MARDFQVELVPYTNEWVAAVGDFNQRMASGGLDPELRFPEDPHDRRAVNQAQTSEHFVAVEGSSVRGAYFLTHECWTTADGRTHRVANFRLPLSEGFIDPNYRGVGKVLLTHALENSPLLYCLGIGDRKRSLARLLAREDWVLEETPFYFRCVHVHKVLRNLHWLRRNPRWRIALDAAAWTVGPAAVTALQSLRTKKLGAKVTSSIVPDFSAWADDIWGGSKGGSALQAIRDSRTLNRRYPVENSRFIRLAVCSGSDIVGWAVLLATVMQDHRHFGNLKVGTVVDCLALPGHEQSVVHAATRHLECRKVDLIVSNQSHREWCSAFERQGFFSGPSNRLFTPSPRLVDTIDPFAEKFPLTHLTRGDGAGPIHL